MADQEEGMPRETESKENRRHFQWEPDPQKRQEVYKTPRLETRNSGQMRKHVQVRVGVSRQGRGGKG